MMNGPIRRLVSTAAIAYCLGSGAAAFAQEVDNDQSTGAVAERSMPGDIVVTAQRKEQSLTDVPVAVSVASGEQIQQLGLTNVIDVTQRLNNVKLITGGSSDLLQIRGVGSGNNAGFEQSVATFVDGVYRSRARAIRSALFDIERVEVLKGPQSTFFGNNAIAGALNITTRKVGDRYNFNGTALYSPSDGEFILEGGMDMPVADTFGIRIAAQFKGMDGYIDNEFLDDMEPRQRNFATRASLRWEPTANFRSDLRFDYARSRDKGAFPVELANCPPPAGYPFNSNSVCARYLRAQPNSAETTFNYRTEIPETSFSNDLFEVAFVNELDLGNVTFTSTTGWFKHDPFLVQQVLPVPLSGSDQTADPVNAPILGPASLLEDYNSFSQELRAATSLGPLDLTVGAYYAKSNLYLQNNIGAFWTRDFAGQTGGIVPDGTPVVSVPSVDQKDTTWSFFVAGTLELTDRLRANAGLRYSRVSKEAHRTYQIGTSGRDVYNTFTPFTAAQQAALRGVIGGSTADYPDPDRVDDKLMPSFSLQYDLSNDVVAYASYATGFKAGGYGMAPTPQFFEPETVDSYELGLKGRVAEGLYLTTAVFLSKFSDLQVSSPTQLPNGTTATIINNAAGAETKGVEVEAEWRANDWLTLRGNVGYTRATYEDFPSGTCTVLQSLTGGSNCAQDLSGKTRAYAPKWNGGFSATATIPMSGDHEIKIDPLMYFSSKYFQQDTADPLFVQKGFAKLDLRVGYGPSDGRWELAIIGKNLTDKLTTGYKATVSTSPGAINGVPDRPRSVAIQLTIR